MPVYEYRCSQCRELTTRVSAVSDLQKTVACADCGELATRIISSTSVHRTKASKLARLDPKYDKLVDKAMASTQNAEPDRILKRMKPFDSD
jgi:putative FmdB family regulatory protein